MPLLDLYAPAQVPDPPAAPETVLARVEVAAADTAATSGPMVPNVPPSKVDSIVDELGALTETDMETLDASRVKELVANLKVARKEEPSSSSSSSLSTPSLVTLPGKLQRKQQHLDKLLAQCETIGRNWVSYKASMQTFLLKKFSSARP